MNIEHHIHILQICLTSDKQTLGAAGAEVFEFRQKPDVHWCAVTVISRRLMVRGINAQLFAIADHRARDWTSQTKRYRRVRFTYGNGRVMVPRANIPLRT